MDFANIGSSITSSLLGAVPLVATIIFSLLAIAGVWFWLKVAKQFNAFCLIFDKQPNGTIIVKQDKGGVFRDPLTNKVSFKLQKGKTTLKPQTEGEKGIWFPYTLSQKGKVVVFLRKTGAKSYVFLDIQLKDKDLKLTVTDEDLEWAIREYHRSTKTYGASSWKELLPYAMWALVVVGTIVLIALVLKEFDTIGLATKELARAAEALRQASTGTTIVTP